MHGGGYDTSIGRDGRGGAGHLVADVAHAQNAEPAPGQTDIMPALLQEVRGLRVAIEQMTSSGSRVQLALGRLQLQEQRLTAANGRLAEGRNQLAGAQRHAAQLQEQVDGSRRHVGRRARCPSPTPRPVAEEMRRMLT